MIQEGFQAMSAIRRTPCLGRALAAGAFLGLVGCHQVPSAPGTQSVRGWKQEPKDGGSITPAQEADVQISLGRVAERQGDLEQAMAAYRTALTRDGRRADAYLRLAVLHDKQGKFRESAELYRKALDLRPGDPDIFCDMGYSHYLQRRWAESEMNLRQAIAVAPDHQRAHNNLALLLVRDNRLEDALAEFRKGGSDPARAHVNLAFALTMDQRWEPAREHYKRALALDPALQLAKDRLGQLDAMVAKREKRRNGAPMDSKVLTTSIDAPSPRPDVPAATAPATATATAPEAARPQGSREPRQVATAATFGAPRRPAKPHVFVPPLPIEDKAGADLWSMVTPPAGASARRQPGTSARAPLAAPERRASDPQPPIPPPKASSGPLLAVDAPKPAPPPGDSPKRITVPPPRPAKAMTTSRPMVSGPLPPPPTTHIPSPIKPTQTSRDTGQRQATPLPDLPPLQSIP
jgi:Flp pilus assembly protein TadD